MTSNKVKLFAPFAILALALAAIFILINSRPEAKQQDIASVAAGRRIGY